MKKKDYIIRAIDREKTIRIFIARTTNMVQEIRNVHKSSATASAALGRLATMTSIIGLDQKADNLKTTIKFEGNGLGGRLIAVSDNKGNIKVTATNPRADLPSKSNGKLDVAGYVGRDGSLGIIKDYGLKEAYTGISEIVSGEIAEDFANYYFTSEQTPSVVSLGVLVDTDLSIKAAGGIFVQVLPGIADENISKLEEVVKKLRPISELIDQDKDPEKILDMYFAEFEPEVLDKTDVSYKCDCSYDRFERGLISLGKSQLEEILEEDGKIHIVCEFCKKEYEFDEDDLKNIISNL